MDQLYKNEEMFNAMSALNIEDDISKLRYQKVILATDADVADHPLLREAPLRYFIEIMDDRFDPALFDEIISIDQPVWNKGLTINSVLDSLIYQYMRGDPMEVNIPGIYDLLLSRGCCSQTPSSAHSACRCPC